MGGLIWNKVFHAMYATPISPRDIALGNLAWIAARLTAHRDDLHARHRRCSGRAESPLVVLAIPAAVLTGMAFAGPIAAFSATQKNPNRFATIFRFGITPLFLFSGTFFPVSSLPTSAPGAGLADAAVPRRRAHPRPVARHDRATTRSPRSIHVVYLTTLAVVGALPDDPDHRTPAGARMTALRVTPDLRDRQPSLAAPDRAQPVRLQARLAGPPVGLLRAAVLPARDRLRAGRADRDDPGPGRRSRSATSCSSRRRCSRPPR